MVCNAKFDDKNKFNNILKHITCGHSKTPCQFCNSIKMSFLSLKQHVKEEHYQAYDKNNWIFASTYKSNFVIN